MTTEDDNFDEQFAEAFKDEPTEVEEPEQKPTEQPKDDPVQEDGGKDDTEPKEDEEEQPQPVEKSEEPAQPQTEEKPVEEAKPLTLDDVRSVLSEIRTQERDSSRELESTVDEVLEAYYPDGLSNVLVDEASGKELRTPQDVVDASGGQMSHDEAAQWLMNEQYKLDRQVAEIKDSAKQIAETTLKFKQDAAIVLEKYEPLFKQYPQVQQKVWDHYNGLIQADKDKGVILKAPDMQKFYDDFLEPYRMAYEYSQQQPATQATQEPAPQEPPKPTAEDRMDESGDGGNTDVDDPNDFAAQVAKELKTGV